MKKIFTLAALITATLNLKAQQAPLNEPYGKVDKADLEMTTCGFEKDANAEILINQAVLYYDEKFNVVEDFHKRIKVFNDNGKNEANIVIVYYGGDKSEYITDLQAETFNENNGAVEITKLDKKSIFIKPIDKQRSEMVFTFPDVKAGSVLDFKYTWTDNDDYKYIPTWTFQDEDAPVRFSQIETKIPDLLEFRTISHSRLMLTAHTQSKENGSLGIGADAITYTNMCDKRVMDSIPSLSDEPYMSSTIDNLAAVSFVCTSVKPINSFIQNLSDTWVKVGNDLINDDDFGHQIKKKLTNEDVLVNQAKSLKTDDEKIAFLFNSVKTTMKWDGSDQYDTNDGTSTAWDNKSGNATEINLILLHLLKKAGVKAMPMLVSTREHGKVNPTYVFLRQFNRAVVYIPVDGGRNYILDASNKYNIYNEIPSNLLNSSGLYIDADNNLSDLIFIEKTDPVRQVVFITAEIKPDGKLSGTAQISSFSYNRINGVSRYKTDGEKKYIDYLQDNDNNLKISAIKFDNMDVDSLPLVQNINFDLDLSGSDDNYIYVNPNLFTSLHSNIFLKENRYSDIDFGYRDNMTITGLYKLPAGYTLDAAPKSISMVMPDTSIVFKRIVGMQDGSIMVRYTINYRKSIYFKEDYPTFHEFFKKMYEMLNEQIVLKKS
jgi:hypothetical protein